MGNLRTSARQSLAAQTKTFGTIAQLVLASVYQIFTFVRLHKLTAEIAKPV
jgi:hypothetical protein